MRLIARHFIIIFTILVTLRMSFGQVVLSSEGMSGGNFQFTINGTAGSSVDVEASSDLVTWTNLGSVMLTGGSAAFVDTSASSFTNRFYCAQQTNVCSSNTVGFITVTVPAKNPDGSAAFVALANQLNNPSGSNTLEVLFGALPAQSQVSKWNLANQGFDVSQKGGSPAHWNYNFSLDPSQGAALVHAGGTNPVTIIFVGEVPQGPQVNTNFPSTIGGVSLMSSIVPHAGTLDGLVFSAGDGDQIQQFISQAWVTLATRTNGYWSPAPPTVQFGESFSLVSGTSSKRIWVEDFPAQPCSQEPFWSFMQIGDLHAGELMSGYSWTNTLNTLLASNQAWNLKLVVSPGDCYEGYTNNGTAALGWSWTNAATNLVAYPIGGETLTNGMWRIKAAGISWLNVPGNHDSDHDDVDPSVTNVAHWNQVFGTNFYAQDPYWFSNRVVGDTRDISFMFTNGTTKMLFIGLRWVDPPLPDQGYYSTTNGVFTAYSTNCTWASNLALTFPDHLVVAVMHQFVDTNGLPSMQDGSRHYEGPGIVAWNALKSSSNLMMVLSGHDANIQMTKSSLQCDDGHMVESVKFDTQSPPREGTNTLDNGGCFVLYTVYPSEHYVRGRVFNSDGNRFLTNGEFSSCGFVNDWTFPFKRLP